MDVKYKKQSDKLFIYLSGELDECVAVKAKTVLDDIIDQNLNIKCAVIDLGGLSFMDSTGIGMLIGRYKRLARFSVPTYLTGANVAVEKILEISGLYSIMPKY